MTGTVRIEQQRLFGLESTPYGLKMSCLAPSCDMVAVFSEPITLEDLTAYAGTHLKEKNA